MTKVNKPFIRTHVINNVCIEIEQRKWTNNYWSEAKWRCKQYNIALQNAVLLGAMPIVMDLPLSTGKFDLYLYNPL